MGFKGYERDRHDSNAEFWAAEALGSGADDSDVLNETWGEGAVVVIRSTAVSGTSPTLDVDVQASEDNSDWTTLGSITQITAANEERNYKLQGCGDKNYQYLRLSPTIGGSATPKVTVNAWLAI